MMRTFAFLLVLLLVACAPSSSRLGTARAALSSFVLLPTADAAINEASPAKNYGASGSLSFRADAGQRRTPLVRFDLSTLPAGAIVNAATLTIRPAWTSPPTGAGALDVRAITTPWAEASVTWASFCPGGVCGYSASSAASATIPAGQTAPISVDVAALVQAWANGTPNEGLALVVTNTISGSLWSRETTWESPPSLAVSWSPAPTCTDSAKNGAETDVDCGGGTCPACANGLACSASSDCASGICGAGVCRPVGGEAIAVISTCPAPSSATITPTTYAYGAGVRLIDHYPAQGTPTGAAVVHFHGYGVTRSFGDFAAHCQVIAARGVACFSADFSVHYLQGPADAIAAVQWVRANAAQFGVDPSRLQVTGTSLGGALACKVGAVRPSIVKQVVIWYGLTRFNPPSWASWLDGPIFGYLGVSGASDPAYPAHAAAADCVPAWGDPPLLMSHGGADLDVLPALTSAVLLPATRAAGVDGTLIMAPGKGHAYWFTARGAAEPSSCTLLGDAFDFTAGL